MFHSETRRRYVVRGGGEGQSSHLRVCLLFLRQWEGSTVGLTVVTLLPSYSGNAVGDARKATANSPELQRPGSNDANVSPQDEEAPGGLGQSPQ